MSSFTQEELEQALKQCESEPIHQIGKIQPHGMLLVLSTDASRTVLQASNNTANFLDLACEMVLGKTLASLIGEASAMQVEQMIMDIADSVPSTGIISIIKQQKILELQARVFTSGESLILEFENFESTHHKEHLVDLLLPVQQMFLRSENVSNIYSYFNQISTIVRTITGFDRVMVYRFDSNWDGEVIAENRCESTQSYLNQRFPASDIPPQARRLYTCNLVRLVADVEAHPIPILPVQNPVTHHPLDMTHVSLRSLSPVHLEYLSNMGVHASMSISLLQNGRLWGLIACHHMSAKRVSVSLQEVAAFISRMASAKLNLIESLEQHRLENNAIHIVGDLLRHITYDSEEGILQRLLPELLGLVNATGAILLVEGPSCYTARIEQNRKQVISSVN